MNIGIVDLIIICYIILGGLIGFKQGMFKKLATTVGLILVVVISFILKNKLSIYFYENLPFLDLWGVFKGIQVLNVVFYEAVAFLVIASVLMLIYNMLLTITGIIEKVLKATVILSIPSKIIGFIIGIIENYLWTYIILFILTLPIFSIKDIYTSKAANFILENTPYLSKYTNKTIDVYNDIYKVVEDRKEKTNKELNEEAMDLMLKYDIITLDSAEKLINSNKVSVNSTEFLEKYKTPVIDNDTEDNNVEDNNPEDNNTNNELEEGE